MTRRLNPTTRSAFTLVELLVVITIIALLMTLLLPAVSKIRIAAKRTQAGADIAQLSAAADSFKQEFKFYPPEYFDGTTPDGIAILKQMYPRWNGTGYIVPPGNPLRGIQCLIYFTTGPENTGWAIDGPYAPSPTAKNQKGPFFEYSGPQWNLYTHLDPFGQPYIYFASTSGKKYGPLLPTPSPNYTGTSPYVSPYNSLTVTPYKVTSDKFVNADSVQIISGGADKACGPGGIWAPDTLGYADLQPGADDVANFNGGSPLGSKPK